MTAAQRSWIGGATYAELLSKSMRAATTSDEEASTYLRDTLRRREREAGQAEAGRVRKELEGG